MDEQIAELCTKILRTLQDCGMTVVTAESCSAGAIAEALSQAKGAGQCLHGGIVAYTKAMKTSALGVSPELLESRTAVCAEAAEAMAAGALRRSPAEVAVALTGVAGPEPDEDGNPVGLMFCAVAARSGKLRHLRIQSAQTSREAILADGIYAALSLLHELCSQQPVKPREPLRA
jgi:nicotinamide-nucleotide amidase